MTAKVIYFEKVAEETHQCIQASKSSDMEVKYWVNLTDQEKETALAEADYLITAAYKIPRQLLEKAPNVKLVLKTGIGVDNIDIAAADDLGIMVTYAPGVNSCSVAELTIGMIICLYRKLPFLDRATKSGKWLMWELRPFMFEMRGKTHGIIGMGNVGKAVAKLSQAFATEVLYFDANRLAPETEKSLGVAYRSLEELLAVADIVSLHIPLIPATRNFIGEKELKLMKPTAILINVARGGIVDEAALSRALEGGNLFGAGLDTWSTEPPAPDNPLLKLDCVLGTPHIAGGTREVAEKVIKLSFANIAKVEKGLTPDFLVGKVRSAKK